MVCVVVLGACASPASPDPSPATEAPQPPRADTLDELEAALPEVEEVDGGATRLWTCSDEPERCVDGEVGSSIVLNSATGKPLEFQDDELDIPEQITTKAFVAEDDRDAAAHVDEERDRSAEYDGDFDVAPVQKEGSYDFGQKGSGSLEDIELDGWKGLITDRRSQLYEPGASGPEEDADVFLTTLLLISNGTTVVQVSTSLRGEMRDPDEGPRLVREAAGEYIARLG